MPTDESPLERQLHEHLLQMYEAAKRLKPPYNSTVFIRMLREHGGKETADRLLATGNPSDGFTELFLRGRENMKLSLEYVVLQNPWRQLFEEDQLEVARKRLREYGCELPPEDAASPA